MLSKEAIRKEFSRKSIHVDGGINKIEENFVKVTLGDSLKVYDTPFLKTDEKAPIKEIIIPKEGLVLQPNELYIGRTVEYTETYGFVPVLSGMEELTTVGMEIHITAGFGDNGFKGTWTLEIVCTNPIKVYPGMPIGQIYYYPIIGNENDKFYEGKYLGQIEPTASKLYEEYKPKQKGKVRRYVNK